LTDSSDKFLTGAQAAEFLGVKAATLYAYASRGLIESMPAGGRERIYRLSDLIKMRQSSRGFKTAKDTDAAVWTGPVIKSGITEIRETGHYYRGENALELAARRTSFEQTVELLWETQSAAPDWRAIRPLTLPKQLKGISGSEVDFLDLLKLLLVSIEMTDPVCRKLTGDDVFDTARRLIVTMATVLGSGSERDKYLQDAEFAIASTVLYALSGRRSHDQAGLINLALVLCADHELNASALAARIAASCDASLYSCLLSALGSFSGTLHGSASRRAEDIVTTSMKFKTATAWLKDYLRQFETIPGFGTELYRKGDPRAKLLIESALEIGSRNPHLRRLVELVTCVREQLGAEPNLDVGLAAVSYALSLPPGAGSTIFAISRTSGWIAHSREQRLYGGQIRPRARYIGKV